MSIDVDLRDPCTFLEDVTVEIRSWPAPLELGIGVTAYIHPGVVVAAVSDGAVVYLAPGARIEDLAPGALEAGAVTVTSWTTYPHLPQGRDVTVMADPTPGRTLTSTVAATPCKVSDPLRAHAEAATRRPDRPHNTASPKGSIA